MTTVTARIKTALRVALGLVVLALLAGGVAGLVYALWVGLASLNPTVAAGLVAAAGTVVVSVVSVLYSKHIEQRINLRKELREKKIPVYEELIEFIFKVVYSEREGQAMSVTEMVQGHSRVTQRAIVWASDDVLKSYHMFRVASLNADANKLGLALAIEGLFLAIRQDLGHKNVGMFTGQVLSLFMNDVHKLAET